jgi:hypothetical protein
MERISKLLFFLTSSALVLALVLGLGFAPDLRANKDLYKAAREKYGKEIKACKHCHVKPLPKEDDNEFNELGEWLMKQKESRGADTVDVSWLEEYPKK